MTNKQAINLLIHMLYQIYTICPSADQEVYEAAVVKAIEALEEE